MKNTNKMKRNFLIAILLVICLTLTTAGVYSEIVKKIPTSIEVTSRALTLGVSPDYLDFGVGARGEVKRGNDITLHVESVDVDFNITLRGTDLTGVGVIDANAVEYRVENDENWNKVSSNDETILSGTPSPEERNYLVHFRINVPSDANLGLHTGLLYVTLNTL